MARRPRRRLGPSSTDEWCSDNLLWRWSTLREGWTDRASDSQRAYRRPARCRVLSGRRLPRQSYCRRTPAWDLAQMRRFQMSRRCSPSPQLAVAWEREWGLALDRVTESVLVQASDPAPGLHSRRRRSRRVAAPPGSGLRSLPSTTTGPMVRPGKLAMMICRLRSPTRQRRTPEGQPTRLIHSNAYGFYCRQCQYQQETAQTP